MSPSDRLHAARKATGEPKIALAVDHYDWHARDLTAAFARAGTMAVLIRLSQCGFDTRRRSGSSFRAARFAGRDVCAFDRAVSR
jgi:hypothetical protein